MIKSKMLKTLTILSLFLLIFSLSCSTMTVKVPDVETIKGRYKTYIANAKNEKEIYKILKDWIIDYEVELNKLIVQIETADGYYITVIDLSEEDK